MILPLMVLLALEGMLPAIPSPVSRDTAAFFGSDAGQTWMSGNWIWFVILIVQFTFNTALWEELLFRGLLPRMSSFGRFDWLVNGLLFASYHLHEPWAMPHDRGRVHVRHVDGSSAMWRLMRCELPREMHAGQGREACVRGLA